jgi:hypothetical protein
MSERRSWLWAALALLAALPSSARAQPLGQLIATVTDPAGLPAAGAVVSVRSPAEQRAQTDESGSSTLALRPGPYDVAATRGDLASPTRRVVVESPLRGPASAMSRRSRWPSACCRRMNSPA